MRTMSHRAKTISTGMIRNFAFRKDALEWVARKPEDRRMLTEGEMHNIANNKLKRIKRGFQISVIEPYEF